VDDTIRDEYSINRGIYPVIIIKTSRPTFHKHEYKFNCIWFDPTGSRTHDLPHSRRARQPLYHRCSLILLSLKNYLYVHEMIPLVVYRKLNKNNIFKNLKLSLFLLNWCMELQVKYYNRVHLLR
jgi:hypothetical protein